MDYDGGTFGEIKYVFCALDYLVTSHSGYFFGVLGVVIVAQAVKLIQDHGA